MRKTSTSRSARVVLTLLGIWSVGKGQAKKVWVMSREVRSTKLKSFHVPHFEIDDTTIASFFKLPRGW